MSKPAKPTPTPGALTLQIGQSAAQTSELIEEIGHSGVAKSPSDVEQMEVIERDHSASGFASASSPAPVPIVTSD